MPGHDFAAMTLHLGLHSNHRNAEQQQEVREARRLLRERVRDDWDYPPLLAWQTTSSPPAPAPEAESVETDDTRAPGGFKIHSQSISEHLQVIDWRERGCSSSTSEDDGEDLSMMRPTNEQRRKKFEVRFEAPDSVGTEISDRRLARKVRRRKELEEEISWNEGLSHYTARRDIWCGARPATQVRAARKRSSQQDRARPPSSSASAGSTPRTSTSSTMTSGQADTSLQYSSNTSPERVTSTSPITSAAGHAPFNATANATATPYDPLLIPVAAQILPNHPIRRRIGPSMYSEIYAKIILQSRTPSVPINLGPLVLALIQGWKDDGEWPPKSGPLEKSIGRKKGAATGLRDGVKAVGKILRITGGESVVKDKG